MEKTERQLNLIALLMSKRRPLRSPEVHKAIYSDAPSEEAFKRKFERDKAELAEIGIVVETVPTDAWGDQKGFVLEREETLLPDLDLAPHEYAALMLAAQAWQGRPGGVSPRTALLKLSATGADGGSGAPWLLPRVDVSSPPLEALFGAVERRKRVTFSYRTGGAGEPAQRTVDPHALHHRGAWYLIGFDHDRGEVRHFKVDRIDGDVSVGAGKSPDFEAPDPSRGDVFAAPGANARERARISFAPEVSWWVERRTGAERVAERPDGWVELNVGYEDLERFTAWVLGFGDDAVALSPDELRGAVVDRLRGTAKG